MDRSRFDLPDGARPSGLFDLQSVLDAVPVRDPVWSRCRIDRRIGQSLCGKPLFFLCHELPSLLLRCRCSHQPGHHGAGPQTGQMERGLPMDFFHSGRDSDRGYSLAASVEAERSERRRRHEGQCRDQGNPESSRSPADADCVFLLLRRGGDLFSVDAQLFCRDQAWAQR